MSWIDFIAQRQGEILTTSLEHLVLVGISTGIAVAIGIPFGILMTRIEVLRRPLLGFASVMQTIPSLALFGFLLPIPVLGGIGNRSAVVALVLYALLPILRNTFTGLQSVDRCVVDAGKGLGMTDMERLRYIELPLAMPTILAGIRIATVVSVGLATIAAAIGAGGLGNMIFRGLSMLDNRLILAGAVPAAVLALLLDMILGMIERRLEASR